MQDPLRTRRRPLVYMLVCLLLQPWCSAALASVTGENPLTAETGQAAQILGIQNEVDRLLAARQRGANSESELHELNCLRAHIFRKIFDAVLQIRATNNHILAEIAYTNDVTAREQRKENDVQQLFNIANFAQFGTLYSLEGRSRIHDQFTQSAVLTGVSAGLGLTLPIAGIMYGKYVKAKNVAPPKFIAHAITGGPVDGSSLAPLVNAYMDLPEPGSTQTRREELYAFWKKQFHADISKKETLCGINDGKPKGLFLLQTRSTLLWSLYTSIQGFNRELLPLLNVVKSQPVETVSANSSLPAAMTIGATQAAHLLKIEPLVTELASLKGTENERKFELQITFLENILAASLDMRAAEDQAQVEINHHNDTVLASLEAGRGKFLQKTYEANFMQTGILGSIATLLYLKGEPKAGNTCFVVAGGLGTLLSTISFVGMHGGWRKENGDPNSLAGFFDLKPNNKYPFSPLVWSYLHAPCSTNPGGQSPKDYLMDVWEKHHSVSVDLKSEKTLARLGGVSKGRYDTINLVENRVRLLKGLKVQLQQFDSELLELFRFAWPAAPHPELSNQNTVIALNKFGASAANLLHVQALVQECRDGQRDALAARLAVTRDVFEAFLDASSTCAKISRQIVIEGQALGRLMRERDRIIQLTNIANFYQINVLDIIIDGWLLNSTNPKHVLAGNRITIISGIMAPCMAFATIVEGHGGIRRTPSQPNPLGQIMDEPPPDSTQLSPLMVRYLDSKAPMSDDTLTRREILQKYWKESAMLSENVKHPSTVQKLSAYGKAHHGWSETIKLISNRLTMLSDLRVMLDAGNIGLEELLSAVD